MMMPTMTQCLWSAQPYAGHLYHSPHSYVSRHITHKKRGWKDSKRVQEGLLRNSIFWTQQGCCTCDLTATVAACPRPAEDQANQHSSMGGGRDYENLLLAAGGGRAIFQGCGPWSVKHAPVDAPHPCTYMRY